MFRFYPVAKLEADNKTAKEVLKTTFLTSYLRPRVKRFEVSAISTVPDKTTLFFHLLME